MKVSNVAVSNILLLSALIVPLAGCDLLGMGPKKEVKPKQVSAPVAVEAPATKQADMTQALPKDILARVGSWNLTEAEFNERLKLLKQSLPDFNENDSNSKKLVLDELIRQQLLVQDAEESGVGNQKEIKDAIEDFRKTLLVQDVANRLTKDVVATEADAQKYYDENKDRFVEPIKWKLREIVVADEATAKTVLVQVLQGGDFAQIAVAQSKGKTAAKGGELENSEKIPEVIQKAVAGLDVGGISSVFKGPEGYYIIKVDSKVGGALRTLESVKKDLIAGLTLQKQQAVVLEHLNKLADKIKVDVNKELLGAMDKVK